MIQEELISSSPSEKPDIVYEQFSLVAYVKIDSHERVCLGGGETGMGRHVEMRGHQLGPGAIHPQQMMLSEALRGFVESG